MASRGGVKVNLFILACRGLGFFGGDFFGAGGRRDFLLLQVRNAANVEKLEIFHMNKKKAALNVRLALCTIQITPAQSL